MANQSIQDFVNATAPNAQARDRFELENPHLLELNLSGRVWAKLGTMIGYTGTVKFTREGMFEHGVGKILRRALRGAKAGRIVRALCDFAPPLAVSDLAMKAGVDVSYASRLLEWLAREGLLTRVSRGPVEAIDRARMIRRWADDYSVLKSNEARSFLDPRGLSNLLRRLPTSRVRYAVTGSLAANRLAPVAPARLAMVYWDDPDEAANDLNLTATDAGANVMLLAPFDDIVCSSGHEQTRA